MRRLNLPFTFGFLAMILFFSALAQADTFDLAAQWSNTSNPNGTWTYREGNNALPLVPNYDFGGTIPGFTPQPAWAPSDIGGHFLPVWLQSSQTGTPSGFYSGAVLPGDVIVHSTDVFNGSGEGIANVIWTSPEAGTIDISGDIWWVRNLGRANDFSVHVGGALVADGVISDGSIYTRSNALQFGAGGIPVLAGEVVELDVTQDPNSFAGEINGVNLQITESTATPEPGSLSLLGLGLTLVAGFSRRMHL